MAEGKNPWDKIVEDKKVKELAGHFLKGENPVSINGYVYEKDEKELKLFLTKKYDQYITIKEGDVFDVYESDDKAPHPRPITLVINGSALYQQTKLTPPLQSQVLGSDIAKSQAQPGTTQAQPSTAQNQPATAQGQIRR